MAVCGASTATCYVTVFKVELDTTLKACGDTISTQVQFEPEGMETIDIMVRLRRYSSSCPTTQRGWTSQLMKALRVLA